MNMAVNEDLLVPENPLPVVRVPMHSRKTLVAYELQFQNNSLDDEEVRLNTLNAITDGSLSRLTAANRTYMKLSDDILLSEIDPFKHAPHLGIVITPEIATNPKLVSRVNTLAFHNRQFLLDLGEYSVFSNSNVEQLLTFVRAVRIDVGTLSRQRLLETIDYLIDRSIDVYLTGVDDRDTYAYVESLPVKAIQGHYLLKPEVINIRALGASKLSLLRLIGSVQEKALDPVSLGKIVSDDAMLSYKLLGVVNSSYFNLQKTMRSVEQAAIFLGTMRMKNWIFTMALIGRSEAPAELLRASLVRARLMERMTSHMTQAELDMAYTVGILSLLDVMLGADLRFLIEHLPLMAPITDCLLDNKGPYIKYLAMICNWEKGQGANGDDSTLSKRMAAAYQEALVWADNVYAEATH